MADTPKKATLKVTDDCIGCGACESVAPTLFKIGADNKSKPLKTAIEGSDIPLAKEAKDACPVDAIKVDEQ